MADRTRRRSSAASLGRAVALAAVPALVALLVLVPAAGPGTAAPGVQPDAPVATTGPAGGPDPVTLGADAAPAASGPEDVQPGRAPQDPQSIRDQADEILARDEYRGPDPTGDTIIERIRRWIDDRIPDVSGPEVGSGAGNGMSYVVVGVVVVGALVAAAWTLSGARRSRRPAGEVDAAVDVTPLRSADEWAEEAERCLRAGDHRGAVRARYRALTTALARRGLVADTPGRTAGEQRIDVTDRAPDLGPGFDAAASLFERVWFGATPVGPAESEAAKDLADRVLAAAPRRARADADDGPGDGDGNGDGVSRTGDDSRTGEVGP